MVFSEYMLLDDWELALKDWGVALTLEVVEETFVPESGDVVRNISTYQIQGVPLKHEENLNVDSRISHHMGSMGFMIGVDQLPSNVMLFETNLIYQNQRYAVIQRADERHVITLGCQLIRKIP